MADVSLTLLILKTRQVDRVRTFYQWLGITFIEEQHGKGPRHYAGQVGDVVIEIYPLPDDGIVDTSTRLGFSLDDLAEIVRALEVIGTVVVKQPTQNAWGMLAVVKDPDGRSVKLTQGEPRRER